MLIDNMLNIGIIKCLLTILLIILVSSPCILASSKEPIINENVTCSWHETDVFFCTRGYSNDLRINNNTMFRTCIPTDVNLSIKYELPLWPLYTSFKVWNETGFINDFKVDHCHFYAANFTGLIIHRLSLLGNFWYIIGHCNDFEIVTSYI
jgi:hypothetical protein